MATTTRITAIASVLLAFASIAPVAHAITPAEFQELSAAEQSEVVAAAFERRLEHAQNCSYHSTVLIRNFHFDNDELGTPVSPGMKRDFTHWMLGNDYRMDANFYDRSSHATVRLVSRSAFDSADGVGRYYSESPGSGQSFPQARIDTARNSTIKTNRYSYWLYGEKVPDADFIFPYTLTQREHFRFKDVDGPLVELTVPWIPFGRTEAKGERSFWLHIEKDFMPVRGEAIWIDNGDWRTEKFEVIDSQLVGDIWMPTKMREILRNKVIERRGHAVVWDITAEAISFDKVTAHDVKVEFPKGTHVVDVIQGVAYYEGDMEKPAVPLR